MFTEFHCELRKQVIQNELYILEYRTLEYFPDKNCTIKCKKPGKQAALFVQSLTQAGEHLPRLLPCSHTTCERCAEGLMRKTLLVCVECRRRHKAPRGAKSFPQNRYILDLLKLLKNRPQNDRVLFAQCPEHKRDCSLYCKDVGCNKSICQLCYIRNHKPHDAVDVAQEEKEHLELQIDLLTKEITQYRQKLLIVKNDIQENTAQSLKRLENKKKFLAKTMNRLIKQTRQQMMAADKDINDNIVAVSQLKHSLESLKEKSIHLAWRLKLTERPLRFLKNL